MFFHDARLQYPVRVDAPNPLFAKMLQQAIGGVEGEIRVCMQYFFQAMGARGAVKYRDMLMATATEELAHIELLAHAVALNLDGAPLETVEAAAKDAAVGAVLGGMNPRHILSSGLSAMPVNSNGVPFDMSHVYATGNMGADMLANATAEASGRTLAARLREMTDDSGMRDMLGFLIARDTMHQEQWLAVIEELGGFEACLPVPNSVPDDAEHAKHAHVFLNTLLDREAPTGRWTDGRALDGKADFTVAPAEPMGEVPTLGRARPKSGAQSEQM